MTEQEQRELIERANGSPLAWAFADTRKWTAEQKAKAKDRFNEWFGTQISLAIGEARWKRARGFPANERATMSKQQPTYFVTMSSNGSTSRVTPLAENVPPSLKPKPGPKPPCANCRARAARKPAALHASGCGCSRCTEVRAAASADVDRWMAQQRELIAQERFGFARNGILLDQ